MSKKDFPELQNILELQNKTRKLYWTSAILFWLGATMALSYYIVPTGTVPSLIPGILMIAGGGLYFFVFFYIKNSSEK